MAELLDSNEIENSYFLWVLVFNVALYGLGAASAMCAAAL